MCAECMTYVLVPPAAFANPRMNGPIGRIISSVVERVLRVGKGERACRSS
jgi:hypothetical protein